MARRRLAKGVVFMATKKDTGKSSTALGAMSALVDHFASKDQRVGYIKPVGHEWRVVKNPDETTTKVDKDVIVFQKRFGLETSWDDLSPIVIDRGMTRRYLDGEIDSAAQLLKVEEAYARISQAHDFVVVEGTGHAGVGSIIDMNNAQVAAALGLDAVLVVGGGLGSSFDEFAANKAICDAHGVAVRGVIVNKVVPSKVEMISHYFQKALARWNIPLICCVPFKAGLDSPCALDFERLFDVELLAGEEHRLRSFAGFTMVSTSATSFAEKLTSPTSATGSSTTLTFTSASPGGRASAGLPRVNATASGGSRFAPGTLFVAHAHRTDVALTIISHAEMVLRTTGKPFNGALILTGSDAFDIKKSWLYAHMKGTSLPIMHVESTPFEVVTRIENYTAKLNADDIDRTEAVIDHYRSHINLDKLLARED